MSVNDLFLFIVEEHQHYTNTSQFVDAVSCGGGHLGCVLCRAIMDRDAANVLNVLESVSRRQVFGFSWGRRRPDRGLIG